MPHTPCLPHPPHQTYQLGICFGWILGSLALNTRTRPLSCWVTRWIEHRAWQAICQVMGLSPSLSHCHFLFHSFSLLFISHFLSYWLWLRLRSDCQIWSMSKIWATPPSPSHKIMNSSYHECVSNVIICRTLPEHMHHIVMYRPTNRGEDHSRDLVPRPRLDTMISALIGGLVTRLYTHFHNIKTPKNYYSLKLCLRKQICYCINQLQASE